MKKDIWGHVWRSLIALLMIFIIVVGCYLEYVILQYYRIDDNHILEVADKSNLNINTNQTYTITTYNIGFGAYSQDYSFFIYFSFIKF